MLPVTESGTVAWAEVTEGRLYCVVASVRPSMK